jgi:hypothetical protein
VLHAPPISFSLNWLSKYYLAKRTGYECLHYIVFSGHLPLPPP